MHFTREYVVYKIRDRWPRFYRAAVSISRVLNSIAGGGPEGASSLRGWLFQGPRGLAAKLIGTAPDVAVEIAVDLARQTIDTLLRQEGTQVVYSFPNQSFPPNIPGAEANRRRRFYFDAMSAYCRERMIPTVNPAELARQSGETLRLSADGWHEDAAGREVMARLYARSILQALEGHRSIDAAR
jgi:hypothetical protein